VKSNINCHKEIKEVLKKAPGKNKPELAPVSPI
jgi:hypothetical protein